MIERRLDFGSTEPQKLVFSRPRRLIGAEREAKLNKCGSWYTFFSPQDGMRKSAQFQCKLKECPSCGERRGLELKDRLESLIRSSGVNMAKGLDISVIRKIGKENYLRLPQSNGTEIIFLDPSTGYGEEIPFFYFEEIDWTRIQNTPDGRITSGNLGKKETSSGDGYRVAVTTYEIDPQFSKIAKECEMRAIAQTYKMNPRTESEIQESINQRQFYYEFYLKTNNVVYETGSKYAFGKLCLTDWSSGISQSFSTLRALNLVSQIDLEEFLKEKIPKRVM